MKTPYSEEGYQFMSAAFAVFNHLGGGMLEEIYQESIEIELNDRNIPFQTKQTVKVFYKGKELVKRYVPDLFVFGGLIVELKAVSKLAPEHSGQLMNYLRITRHPVGYLLNFGPMEQLEWKRIIVSARV